MEGSEEAMDDTRKMIKDLASLTRRLVESHIELSASNRGQEAMLKELKDARQDHKRMWRNHEAWLRDHEVRLQSHYRAIDRLR